MAQPNLTPKVVVVAAAVAAVAADIADTIQMSHLCGVKKLFYHFFVFSASIFFQVYFFPCVRPP